VATALLVECEGLRSPCGCLMTTSVVGLRRQHCLVASALLDECEGLRSPLELGHNSPERGHGRGKPGHFLAGASIISLLAGASGSSSSLLAGASGSSLLAGASGLLVEELLEAGSLLALGASGFLVKELLAAGSLLASASGSSLLEGASGSSLLAGASGLLVKELLVASSLLAGASGSGCLALTSGFLVKMALAGCRLEAMVLIFPQGVNRPLPIQVGAFCAGASPKKDGPPGWVRRQYPSSLFVFAKESLKPFFVMKGTTNIGRGIEFLINVEHPFGGAWGRLRPLVLQPR
jgi:hypothetical protein